MRGKKQITLRELYDTFGLLVEQYGDRPVVSEGCDCDCDGDVGGVEVDGDVVFLHRVDTRTPVNEADLAKAQAVKAAETEKRAVEFDAWRRRVLDADEEARNLPRNGLTLDPL